MRLRALIAWIAFAVLAFLFIHAPEKQNAGLPIVDAHKVSAPLERNRICRPIEPNNPCDRVNCYRPETRSIA